MTSKFFLIIFCCLSVITGYGQEKFYQNKGLSVTSGLHLTYPSILFRNERSFKNTIPSWQLWINKEFFHPNRVALVISLGTSHDLFNASRKIENTNGTVVYQQRRISILYGNVEAGLRLSFFSEAEFPFFTALSLRVATSLSENFSKMYVTEPGSSDVGLNFKIGTKFSYGPTRLFVQLNYYQGLSKVARNNVLTSTGAYDSYIQNRSLGLQLGVFL
jgi:hypothetical protein